jgi:hypothetical protein
MLFRSFSDLIPHIFFPRKLPTANFVAFEELSQEYSLLSMMTLLLEELASADSNKIGSLIPATVKLFKTWKLIQNQGNAGFNVDLLSQSIKSLSPGESISLYINAQNAGMILAAPADQLHPNILIISAFAASQTSKTLMRASGPLFATFPGVSYHVLNSKLISSRALTEQLSYTLVKIAMEIRTSIHQTQQ